MPSFVPNAITTSYVLLAIPNSISGISRRAISVQNQSNTIVWIQFGDSADPLKQEFAFLYNCVVAMDYSSDLIRKNIYIKSEELISDRSVVVSFW